MITSEPRSPIRHPNLTATHFSRKRPSSGLLKQIRCVFLVATNCKTYQFLLYSRSKPSNTQHFNTWLRSLHEQLVASRYLAGSKHVKWSSTSSRRRCRLWGVCTLLEVLTVGFRARLWTGKSASLVMHGRRQIVMVILRSLVTGLETHHQESGHLSMDSSDSLKWIWLMMECGWVKLCTRTRYVGSPYELLAWCWMFIDWAHHLGQCK